MSVWARPESRFALPPIPNRERRIACKLTYIIVHSGYPLTTQDLKPNAFYGVLSGIAKRENHVERTFYERECEYTRRVL